jgi:hypothetical protein
MTNAGTDHDAAILHPAGLHPAGLHPDVQRVADAIEHAVQGMSAAQLDWAPQGKWSAANILEHLAITYGGTARAMRKVAERRASIAKAPATGYQRVATFLVTGIGYLPGGRKAPDGTSPAGLPPDAVLSTIRVNLAEMDVAMSAAAQHVSSSQPIADHPVLGPLTLRQWRRFHWVHARHHMKQIARLRRQFSGS